LLLQQESASFEVIIIDGMKGGTLLHHLPLENVTVLTAKSGNMFTMLNQALTLAKGQ
jgi:hypothetical protein